MEVGWLRRLLAWLKSLWRRLFGGGPAAVSCISFNTVGTGQPNPWVDPTYQVSFEVFVPPGAPGSVLAPFTEVRNQGGFIGLYMGNQIRITNFGPASSVRVKIEHTAADFPIPGTVSALSGGATVASAQIPPQQSVWHIISLSGSGIDEVVIFKPADEAVLGEFCWS